MISILLNIATTSQPNKRKYPRISNCHVSFLILGFVDLYIDNTEWLHPFYICSKTEKKRKRPLSNLPDGFGLGDHIQLLQIYERWYQTDYDIGWCKDHGLQVGILMYSGISIIKCINL